MNILVPIGVVDPAISMELEPTQKKPRRFQIMFSIKILFTSIFLSFQYVH